MRKLSYSTGRHYDAPQVLEIEVIPVEPADDLGMYRADLLFTDKSRNIKGRITSSLMFEDDSDRIIGVVVMNLYDRGQYDCA